MQLLSFDDHQIPAKYQATVEQLLERAFGPDDPDTPFEPEAYRAFLAVDEEAGVVGYLSAYVRDVGFENESLTFGMIGDVTTADAFRQQGIAKTLLKAAHDYFRSLDINFSILFAYDPPVYASTGYQLMENEVYFQDEDAVWKTLVFRGSMYLELADQPWPAGLIDLRGRAV